MIIKSTNSPSKLFMVACGDWEIVVEADDKSSALSGALEACFECDKMKSLSAIMICLDVSGTVNELSIERSLKFIPISEVADLLEDKTMAATIKTFFNQ